MKITKMMEIERGLYITFINDESIRFSYGNKQNNDLSKLNLNQIYVIMPVGCWFLTYTVIKFKNKLFEFNLIPDDEADLQKFYHHIKTLKTEQDIYNYIQFLSL